MSLKTTVIIVGATAFMSFSSGWYVKGKVANAQIADMKRGLAEQAVAIEKGRLESEKKIAEAIAARDAAVADLDEERRANADNISRMRSNADAAIAAARRANAKPVAPSACEKQLRELRALAKRSAALHYRSAKTLEGSTADFGKAIAGQRAVEKAVNQEAKK